VNVNPATSTINVWTYKEGLLSKVAHDLCILATGVRAPATVEGARVKVEVAVPTRGLRVQGQVKDAQVIPLRDKDHKEIEGNIVGADVLDAGKYPEVKFTGEAPLPTAPGDVQVDGALTIRGATQRLPITCRFEAKNDKWVVTGEVRLRQTAFQIKPYSALFGTLKVQDEVKVTWRFEYPRVG
jgi:polyisoprenoid-binding protein YceI